MLTVNGGKRFIGNGKRLTGDAALALAGGGRPGCFYMGGPGTNQTLILKTAVFEKQRWTVPKPSPNPRRKAPRQLLLSRPAGGQDPRAAFGGFGFPVEGVETVLPVTGSGREPEKTLWDGAGALPWPGWEPGGSGWDTPHVWEWQSRFPELTLIFVSPPMPPCCGRRQTKVEDIVQEIFNACKTNHHASQ